MNTFPTFDQLIGTYFPKVGRDIINSVINPVEAIFKILGPSNCNSLNEFLLNTDPARITAIKNFLFNAATFSEATRFSEKKHGHFRAHFAQHPLVKIFPGIIGTTNTDIVGAFPPAPAAIKLSNRFRGYDNIPLCFILFIVSALIFNDQEARLTYMQCISESTRVPNVFNEHANSHRNGVIHNKAFEVSVDSRWDQFVKLIGFEETIFDLKWLRDISNMNTFINLLSEIDTFDGNYILFVSAVKPTLNAGQTVSASGIDTEVIINKDLINVTPYPGTNIPEATKHIYFTDAWILGRSNSETRFSLIPKVPNSGTVFVLNNIGSQNYFDYIIGRMSGFYKNSKPVEKSSVEFSVPTESQPENDSKQKKDRFKTTDKPKEKYSFEAVQLLNLLCDLLSNASKAKEVLKTLSYLKYKSRSKTHYRFAN